VTFIFLPTSGSLSRNVTTLFDLTII
jgi:hypothetical protein